MNPFNPNVKFWLSLIALSLVAKLAARNAVSHCVSARRVNSIQTVVNISTVNAGEPVRSHFGCRQSTAIKTGSTCQTLKSSTVNFESNSSLFCTRTISRIKNITASLTGTIVATSHTAYHRLFSCQTTTALRSTPRPYALITTIALKAKSAYRTPARFYRKPVNFFYQLEPTNAVTWIPSLHTA